MKYVLLFSALLLVISIGCQKKDDVFNEKVFVEKFKTVLLKKGLEVKEVKPGPFIKMQEKLPHQLEVSQNNKNPDDVYVFSFDSAEEAKKALEETKFATTSETLVYKYRNNNIVIVHYALPENIGKLDFEIEKSVAD